MLKQTLGFALLAFCSVWIFSCKPALPSGILSAGDMEDILYDYHLAQAMAEISSNKDFDAFAYRAAVLKKHGVTQKEFDSSLEYYMRHTADLQKIYDKLADRFKIEAEALGSSVSDYTKYGNLSANGDTADIWSAERSMVLMPAPLLNQYSFNIDVDTAFRAGDKIMLNFNTNFFYQDGMRNGCAVLAVKFKNDSVASSTNQLSSSMRYSMMVSDAKHLGIKEIRGYFILNKNRSDAESSTTMQLMFLENIQLIRMHENKKEAAERKRLDSIAVHNASVAPVVPVASPTDAPRLVPDKDAKAVPVPEGAIKKSPKFIK